MQSVEKNMQTNESVVEINALQVSSIWSTCDTSHSCIPGRHSRITGSVHLDQDECVLMISHVWLIKILLRM